MRPGVLGAEGLALTANLRAEFTEARVSLGTPAHHRRGQATNGCAIQAGESAFYQFCRTCTNTAGGAFIASVGTLNACLGGSLYVLLTFFLHNSMIDW